MGKWLGSIGKVMKKVSPVFDLSNIMMYLLRKSQVIMGIIEPFLDILGAIIDVLLMPLVPILVPLLRVLAAAIPGIQAFAKVIEGFLKPIADVLTLVANYVAEGAALIKNWLGGGGAEKAKNVGKSMFENATPLGMGIKGIKDLVGFIKTGKINERKQSGIAYVPQTMTAELHRGESVLNARETQRRESGNNGLNIMNPQFNVTAGGSTTLDARVFAQQLYQEFSKKLVTEARRV
jgi:hypothetical protein